MGVMLLMTKQVLKRVFFFCDTKIITTSSSVCWS